jgi:predicted dehydrogenase
MITQKIRWGILGTSFISRVMADAIQASSTSELIAVGSRNQNTANDFAHQFNIEKSYDSYQALLDDDNIDAVYIGLPNDLHKTWIIKAAEARKHILCEKPFVLSVNEVLETKAAIEKAGVFFLEALMYQYHPLTETLKSLISDGVIGKPQQYLAYYSANIASFANATAGGAIRNLGCYPASLILSIANAEPLQCKALGRTNATGNHDHQSACLLSFPDGSIASIVSADDIEMDNLFEIHGTKGSLKVTSNPWLPNELDNTIFIKRHQQPVEALSIRADKPLYTYQIDVLNHQILRLGAACDQVLLWRDIQRNIALQEQWHSQIVV